MKNWDASLINYLFLFLFFISSFLFGSQNQTDSPMLCYGHASLCDKRLDEVAFASSHNSMSNKAEGWYWPDNLYGLTRQMEAGIRGIVIDVWYYKHSVYMCHSHCQFGKKTLFEGLLEIRDFLEENPNEIFTLFIENYVKGVDIEKDIVETDLSILITP